MAFSSLGSEECGALQRPESGFLMPLLSQPGAHGTRDLRRALVLNEVSRAGQRQNRQTTLDPAPHVVETCRQCIGTGSFERVSHHGGKTRSLGW